MGLFSRDRPRIPGDPPHLEIMTKVGHALPDKVRRVLAASTFVGKGNYKAAKQVMKRKQPVPKMEEEYEKQKAEDILDKPECDKMKADKADLHRRMRKLAKQEVKKHEDSELHEALGRHWSPAKSLSNRGGKSVLAPKSQKRLPFSLSKKVTDKDKSSEEERFERDSEKGWDEYDKNMREGTLNELTGKGVAQGRGLFKGLIRRELDARMERKIGREEDHEEKDEVNDEFVGRLKKMRKRLENKELKESFSGQVTRLKKWITGRSRAKNAADKWRETGMKELHNSLAHDRRGKNEYWEHIRSKRDMEKNAKSKNRAKQAQASSDKIEADYHRDQWLKNAAKSGRASRKADRLANYGWNAEHDHKKLPKFGRKLDEAVSRKLIAKKNAEKQRVKYVKRKGELPPIMVPKNMYKFSEKEKNKLKSVLGKQKAQRGEVRDYALLRKKGIAKTTAVVPAVPEQDRNSSVSVHATPPTPGVVRRVAEPAPAHPLDVYKHAVDQYSRTGNPEAYEIAKRASAAAMAREIVDLGRMTFRDNQDKFLSYRGPKERHNTRMLAINSVYNVHNPKPRLIDKIKKLLRK